LRFRRLQEDLGRLEIESWDKLCIFSVCIFKSFLDVGNFQPKILIHKRSLVKPAQIPEQIADNHF
jgi:hypothetical protein